MLRSVEDLDGYAIGATDGDVGHVKDLYFDDEAWVVRYFVVDTGGWLSNRKVLISPFAVGKPSSSERLLPVSLTREKVKNSPDIDTNKPVSRQHERDYLEYYGYPLYWGAVGFWGGGVYPGSMPLGGDGDRGRNSVTGLSGLSDATVALAQTQPEPDADSHLRSCQTVRGYHVHASDGDIGHVQGMLVDDETWAIRYLVVNTSNWWLGHKVLVASQWIDSVRWLDAKVSVDVTRQDVKDSPPFIHTAPLDRQQETSLYEHYGRRSYWTDDLERETEISRI
ncbi:MAG: PRC-barrel domain-containing protein [Pseudomonadota bacterium]|nr:PRC-barrel domain-containing protein [Pseudomonadota bacterium]